MLVSVKDIHKFANFQICAVLSLILCKFNKFLWSYFGMGSMPSIGSISLVRWYRKFSTGTCIRNETLVSGFVHVFLFVLLGQDAADIPQKLWISPFMIYILDICFQCYFTDIFFMSRRFLILSHMYCLYKLIYYRCCLGATIHCLMSDTMYFVYWLHCVVIFPIWAETPHIMFSLRLLGLDSWNQLQ